MRTWHVYMVRLFGCFDKLWYVNISKHYWYYSSA